MRTIILSILLAGTAATPAIAQDHGRWRQEEAQGDRHAAQEERQQQREQAREQRSGGGADVARVREQQPQAQPQSPQPQPQLEARRRQSDGRNVGGGQQNEAQQQQQQQQRWQGRGGSDARRANDRGNTQAEVQVPQQTDQQRQFDGRNRGNWNGGDRRNWNGGAELRQGNRAAPNVMRDRNPLVVNDTRQQAQRSDGRRWANGGWNRDWRNDRRYDWRRYRNSHRSIFRIGIYYDPFGYNYRPFNIGYRLYPAYLGRQYWIDPAMYQLPYPPPGTTWVRYWNDALLVDMYTGEVVDVIRDFFW